MNLKIKQILRESKTTTAIEVQAPNKLITKPNYTTVFLAGSISGNEAKEHQKAIIKANKDNPYIFYNPRRDDYNKDLKQDISNPQFKEQVEWELDALKKADKIVMFLDEDTDSPISLLELGLYAESGKLIVCCEENFYRKGNIDITCQRYGIKQVDTLDELIEILKNDKL